MWLKPIIKKVQKFSISLAVSDARSERSILIVDALHEIRLIGAERGYIKRVTQEWIVRDLRIQKSSLKD